MNNPILNQMLNQSQVKTANNPLAMIQQFSSFRNQMANKNPKQMVDELISSGKMSQEQFNQLTNQAQQMLSMFK